jgi:peptidoglycan/xylan/chitin deacetylase (PgdA/CDA1 family)
MHSGRHEIGLHGWIHERNSLLDEATERDLMTRSRDALEKLSGRRPVGMRTPSWDYSKNTLKIAREMGLLYDSSLMADDRPYEMLADGQPAGVVQLPVEWILDDAPLLLERPLFGRPADDESRRSAGDLEGRVRRRL